MPTYKLYYFNAKGRGEYIRWLLTLGDIKFEDIRLQGEEWQKLKPTTPFGQMPAMEVDGVMIAQSNAIARLIAKRTGRAGKDDVEQAKVDMIVDGGDDMLKAFFPAYFEKDETRKAELLKKWEEEDKPKHLNNFERLLKESGTGYFVGSDITMADIFMICSLQMLQINLDSYPTLKALETTLTGNPKIAEWIKNRPVTEH